jgi:hypothetical protein
VRLDNQTITHAVRDGLALLVSVDQSKWNLTDAPYPIYTTLPPYDALYNPTTTYRRLQLDEDIHKILSS